ncbi:DoxX family protein [Sphingomonas sp. AOB5]|uniref:DoxX family protein n=1 Tax=Sphingomonas sp. AOB5 TaxID=3034017 RepID=UPI0023F7F127|nr:DoxX family protein [Sphingomonas sp. AOB5]MDF7773845.1 DoxX family protein [Sphingomonas sp. AOB5]
MSDWKHIVVQPGWAIRRDAVLLASRLTIGAFLIWGVWDNIVDPARMSEFRNFLAFHDFPMPGIAAPLSVYAQFMCGVAFLAGIGTRWAGLICAINFAVAIAMVDAKLGIRGAFPSACLILFGLIFATIGAGRYSADAILNRNP